MVERESQRRRSEMIWKKGKVYWMDFVYNGKHFQESTKVRNKQDAEEIERAKRTQLAKNEVGLQKKPEKAAVPTLEDFRCTFMTWVNSQTKNERTRQFYAVCYERLCGFRPLGKAILSQIDEPTIESFKLSAIENEASQ